MVNSSATSKLIRKPNLATKTSVDSGGLYGRWPTWHPSENYVVGCSEATGTKQLAVYFFNGTSLIEKDSFN